MKRIILAASVVAMAMAPVYAQSEQKCEGKAYNVTVPMTADDDGAMAFLVNYDTGAKMDSVMVEDGVAVFQGKICKPYAGRLEMDGSRLGTFFIEPGDQTFDPKTKEATGDLNAMLKEINAKSAELQSRFQATQDQAEQQKIYDEYTALMHSAVYDNLDNALGQMLFVQEAYDMTLPELEAALEQHPALKNSKRIQKILASQQNKAATAIGQKFVDFTVNSNGVEHKLSDVVGKGKYVLVDFWASWCGPCRREMPNLKELYNKYGDDLKILGVAVWDEPEASERAVKELGLPWEIWVNGQTQPTDKYGILGIPCLILFDPDGNIVDRDHQGEDLKAAVAKALGR